MIINIGRGAAIDEPALIKALKDGRVRGAALDVFCQEPLPSSSELWELENVLISPHNADMVHEWYHRSVDWFVKNVEKYLLHGAEGLESKVDPSAGY